MKLYFLMRMSKLCYLEECRLTEREKTELDYKKTLLNIAKSHQQAEQLENVTRYYIPTEEKVISLLKYVA